MTRPIAILFTIFTLVITTSLSAQAQPDSSQPYLYYYSQLLGGLIIEHPDGSDSRQIAADVIPPNLTGLFGPGWSPSGKYFAAYGVNYVEYGGYSGAPYVIDLRGQSAVPWLSTVVRTLSMQWSPTGEDILLIIGTFSADTLVNRGSFVWLIDVEHNKVLSEFGFNVDMVAYAMSDITWDVEHQKIMFYLKPDIYNIGDYYRITMGFDGTTARERASANDFIPQVHNLDSDNRINEGVTLSPHGTYKTEPYKPLKLINTKTGQTVNLPLHTGSTICRDFIWTEDEAYMITMDGTLVAGGGCFVPVMGVTNPEGTLWRELGSCSWAYPPCVGWLPSQVDVNRLPEGAPKPVQLDPVTIEYGGTIQIYGVDPAVAHVLNFSCADKYSVAEIRDKTTRQVLYNLAETKCPYDFQNHQVSADGIDIVVSEDPVHHLLATYQDGQGVGVSIWKLSNDHYEPILKLNTQGLTLEFTDHNERLRARNFNGWKIYSVADILASAPKLHE